MGKKLEEKIAKVVVELIEVKAKLNELERAFPYLDGCSFYYTRVKQLEERKSELQDILLLAKIDYTPDAPIEQYLVTEY